MEEYKEIIKKEFEIMFLNGEINVGELLNKGENFLKELNKNNPNYSTRIGKKKIIKYFEKLFYDKFKEIYDKEIVERIIIKNFYDDYLDMESYLFIFNKFYKIIGNIFLISGNHDNKYIRLDNFEIEGNLNIIGKSKIIFLEEGKINGDLNICGHIIINEKSIDDKKIILKNNKINNINLIDIRINDLLSEGSNIDFYIEGNEGNLNLGKLNNIGEIILNNHNGLFFIEDYIKYEDRFTIQNSKIIFLKFKNIDLGKTIFNGVQIKKIYLENTTLNDCIFNGVEFPENYELEEKYFLNNNDGNSKNYISKSSYILSNKQLKDNYRQLKFVMDKNGNYTDANKFYEKEMEYEMLRLGVDKSFFKGFCSLFKNKFIGQETQNLGSKIQLWFGWEFNEFGNNWIRTFYGLLILAFISVIFNILYNYFFNIKIGEYLIFGGGGSPRNFFHFDIIKQYFKLFLDLLYPLYGLKKDYIDGLDNWLTLGFILYKVIYGILLWHLVVALKRTTKR